MQQPETRKEVEIQTREVIDEVTDSLSMPDIIQKLSDSVLDASVEKGILVNRDPQAIAVACVSVAFNEYEQQHIPTEDYIERAEIDTTVTEINRARKAIIKRTNVSSKPSTPKQYLRTFDAGDPFSTDILDMADILIDGVDGAIFSGMKPASSVAASIYAASLLLGTPKSQKEVADATNITEVPIRESYKEILKATQVHTFPDCVIESASPNRLTKIFKSDNPELLAKRVIVRELSAEFDWDEGIHYQSELDGSSPTASVLVPGFRDFTGEDCVQQQMDVLESDFGLEKGSDFILTPKKGIHLSMSGSVAIYDQVAS